MEGSLVPSTVALIEPHLDLARQVALDLQVEPLVVNDVNGHVHERTVELRLELENKAFILLEKPVHSQLKFL